MTKQLKMTPKTTECITFSRVYRMGKVSEGRPRAIVAQFENLKDKITC